MRSRFVDVVFKNVPAGKDHVVQIRQRDEILDQRRTVFRPLAQPDGAHLRQRPNWLGQSPAHGFDSGDQSGGYRAQAHHHYAQFACCGRYLLCCGLLAALFSACHSFS